MSKSGYCEQSSLRALLIKHRDFGNAIQCPRKNLFIDKKIFALAKYLNKKNETKRLYNLRFLLHVKYYN